MTITEIGRAQVVNAADELFYARGIQAVGMDELRTAAGISLKRMYTLFPSKTAIVAEVLRGRTAQWNDGIRAEADRHDTPRGKLLSIFDFLDRWFREDDFRGCAFINSFGELGATMPEVADAAHQLRQMRHAAGRRTRRDRDARHQRLFAEGRIQAKPAYPLQRSHRAGSRQPSAFCQHAGGIRRRRPADGLVG